MDLTDKCLKDFTEWNGNKEFDMMLPYEYPIYLNALIIEFFDTSELLKGFNSFENIFYREYRRTVFEDRKKATEQAIIKANEIYNNL